ncbi:MAG TPA: methylmalonyl Co-A mutase-associated GTPase MeaB [Syntrophorhabdus sp.]|nr:methylmalonyl Co-A mutase-associated GTPase MeaB [Syntrophorhabdus sp.]
MEEKLALMIDAARDKNERALAKLISHVEDRKAGWKDIMKAIYAKTGRTCIIGVTGSPGAGKRSLVGEFAKRLGDRGYTIGIIAVDPSSPFSGGAVLGDRIRMRDISTYQNIFIRSMATRGMLGGLCQAARDVVRIMDFAGKDIVIIETVGVGQDEIEVVSASDYVVLVTYPGGGDSVQAIKAGVMEIADLFVVNKCDRDGADVIVSEISAMLDLSTETGAEIPPVIKTSAFTKEGIDNLVDILSDFIDRKKKGPHYQKEHVHQEVVSILETEIVSQIKERIAGNGNMDKELESILSGKSDPYTAAENLMNRFTVIKNLEKKTGRRL